MDQSIEAWLNNLDLSLLAEWDVLVFLYRHRTSLTSAGQIACLLGYTGSVVGDALDRLESRGLIRGSRASQGVRLYEFSVSIEPPHDGLRQLIGLAENRAGRFLLARKLRERARRRQTRGLDSLHLALKGSATWPKAG